MPALQLSGFADEISADPQEQLDTLKRNQIRHMELRGVWNTNVLDLSTSRIQQLRRMLDDAGVGVSAIGSPIGKVSIRSDLDTHFSRFQVAVERAHEFGTRYIRIFSFYHRDESAEQCRDAVIAQLARMTGYAAAEGVILLHENEKGIYGDVPERCRELMLAVDDPHLRTVFDPANFIQCGVDPARQAWPALSEYVAYFHIKDALAEQKRVVPAGQGDGEVEWILGQAVGSGFSGFLSLEPHLKADDPAYGGDGSHRFDTAANALREVLARLGVTAA